MPAMQEIYRAYNFKLKIQNADAGYFTEASGLNIQIEPIPYRSGGEGSPVRKLPGRADYGPLVLRWGLCRSRELMDWIDEISKGNIVRKDVSIIILKPNGVDAETTYDLNNAWPSKWTGPDLDALSQDVAVETLELQYEGIKRAP